MQYQLEHHLFPTLPRYMYPQVVPIVRKFAKDMGLKYKADGLATMYCDHYTNLKTHALAAAAEA